MKRFWKTLVFIIYLILDIPFAIAYLLYMGCRYGYLRWKCKKIDAGNIVLKENEISEQGFHELYAWTKQ